MQYIGLPMDTWQAVTDFLGKLPYSVAKPLVDMIEKTAKPLTVNEEPAPQTVVDSESYEGKIEQLKSLTGDAG